MIDHSKDGYVIVEDGDRLWDIAAKHLGSGSKYTELVAINKLTVYKRNGKEIVNLRIGQKIYLTKAAASGGSSSSSSSSSSSNCCTNVKVGLLASDSTTLYATWDWKNEAETASYKVAWYYTTIEGLEFVGDVKNITSDDEYYAASKQSTFQIPDGAKQVRFRVRPISKEVDKNLLEKVTDAVKSVVGIETKNYYFVAEWTSWVKYTVGDPLDEVGIPTVELGDVFTKNGALYQKLTVTLENLANVGKNLTHVQFQIAKDNTSILETTKPIVINTSTNYVSYSRDVAVGYEYTVRARGAMNSLYSEWSAFSAAAKTAPLAPSGITVCKAHSKTAVYLEWASVATALSYDVQYTTDVTEFDNVPNLPSTNVPNKATQCIINNLETGKEYYFRIRAVNDGSPVTTSPWSEPSSVTIGTVPAAPTTWSSSTTATTDEVIVLYWTHNSKDGSSQERANVELYLDDEKIVTLNIANSTEEEEKDKTSSLIVTTSKDVYDEYKDQGRNAYLIIDDIAEVGATLKWRVQTKGVVDDNGGYGEWSTMRTINMYARPWLDLSLLDNINGNMIDTVTKFPIFVKAVPGPNTQTPIGYHLTVTAHSIYDIADDIGNIESISTDGLIYSKYFDESTDIQVELSAHNIALKNNVEYTISCTVSMDSGLTATSTTDFSVAWDEVEYIPNAELSLDQDAFMAYIRPYCSNGTRHFYIVNRVNGEFVLTDEVFNYAYGELLPLIGTTDYYWTKMTTEYSNGAESVRYGVGEVGVSSVMGKTVLSTRTTYCTSVSNTSLPSGPWSSTKPSIGSNEYLWVRSVDTFNDGSSYTAYTVHPIGSDEPDSTAIVGMGAEYQTSTTNQSIPTGVWFDQIPTAMTDTGESVYYGVDMDDNTSYCCEAVKSIPITNVLLSVYRREFDGTFKEIAKDLDGELNVTVTDPHPSLDFARYRIVATAKDTGAVRYYDMPAHPINGKAAILQWDEEWTNFDTTEGEFQVKPRWEGSLLKLPYNIDVTDNSKPDVELVNYIGRSNPVSYYGTQTGKSATWNMTIPKSDKDTLYALRRLANWMGDVYVREPSGSGYWANVTVSYSQKHKDVTIPITLTINRVEGGA